jgi:transcriptional regulator with XRE-family HTH domain
MTQQVMAERLHSSRTSVTNIESGNQLLTIHALLDWTAALGVRASDLLRELESDAVDADETRRLDDISQSEGLSESDTEFLRRIRAKVISGRDSDQEGQDIGT